MLCCTGTGSGLEFKGMEDQANLVAKGELPTPFQCCPLAALPLPKLGQCDGAKRTMVSI